MSKFMCKCGEIIRDQANNLPYKGYVFSDRIYFDLFDRITTDIASYIQSRVAGSEREWIAKYFLSGYLCTKDEEIVHDIISRHLIPADLDMYQCPKCGRLHIEHRDDSSRLESFTPDETPHRDIFGK